MRTAQPGAAAPVLIGGGPPSPGRSPLAAAQRHTPRGANNRARPIPPPSRSTAPLARATLRRSWRSTAARVSTPWQRRERPPPSGSESAPTHVHERGPLAPEGRTGSDVRLVIRAAAPRRVRIRGAPESDMANESSPLAGAARPEARETSTPAKGQQFRRQLDLAFPSAGRWAPTSSSGISPSSARESAANRRARRALRRVDADRPREEHGSGTAAPATRLCSSWTMSRSTSSMKRRGPSTERPPRVRRLIAAPSRARAPAAARAASSLPAFVPRSQAPPQRAEAHPVNHANRAGELSPAPRSTCSPTARTDARAPSSDRDQPGAVPIRLATQRPSARHGPDRLEAIGSCPIPASPTPSRSRGRRPGAAARHAQGLRCRQV
jgi:hypothetical protein